MMERKLVQMSLIQHVTPRPRCYSHAAWLDAWSLELSSTDTVNDIGSRVFGEPIRGVLLCSKTFQRALSRADRSVPSHYPWQCKNLSKSSGLTGIDNSLVIDLLLVSDCGTLLSVSQWRTWQLDTIYSLEIACITISICRLCVNSRGL